MSLYEAEADYRRALEIFRDTNDLRSASIVASTLGSVLVALDRTRRRSRSFCSRL
jgi:hypothetical protein